jgi:hypothetical protein
MKVQSKSDWFSTKPKLVDNAELLEKGCFLWVFGWDNIPHLGISKDGFYFAVSLKGLQLNTPTEVIYNAVRIKQTATFLLELNINLSKTEIEACFKKSNLDSDTCLAPVLCLFQFESNKPETLHSLLDFLSVQQMIKQVWSFQIVEKIALLSYNKSDVLKLIQIQKQKYVVGK